MQKFLVSDSIGGAIITKAAVEFLCRKLAERTNPDGDVDISFATVSNDGLPVVSVSDAEGTYPEANMLASSFMQNIVLPSEERAEFSELPGNTTMYIDTWLTDVRKIIASMIDSLRANELAELDALNDGCRLRVVEVPDDVRAVVEAYEETGVEYVSEVKRTWHVAPDWASSARKKMAKFLRTLDYGKPVKEVVFHGGLMYVLDGDIGICVVPHDDSEDIVFLRLASYYRETEEHPKTWFEPIFEQERRCVAMANSTEGFFDGPTVLRFAELVRRGKGLWDVRPE